MRKFLLTAVVIGSMGCTPVGHRSLSVAYSHSLQECQTACAYEERGRVTACFATCDRLYPRPSTTPPPPAAAAPSTRYFYVYMTAGANKGTCQPQTDGWVTQAVA